jgi:hypothetical protein
MIKHDFENFMKVTFFPMAFSNNTKLNAKDCECENWFQMPQTNFQHWTLMEAVMKLGFHKGQVIS